MNLLSFLGKFYKPGRFSILVGFAKLTRCDFTYAYFLWFFMSNPITLLVFARRVCNFAGLLSKQVRTSANLQGCGILPWRF